MQCKKKDIKNCKLAENISKDKYNEQICYKATILFRVNDNKK